MSPSVRLMPCRRWYPAAKTSRIGVNLYGMNKPHVRLPVFITPSLSDPVPNDSSLVPPGIVITGSNMSGKSTFLKTAGVSIVMSQTILTVAAESYESCCFNLTSAIGRMDNLIEGKSYYLDEALAVLRIVQTAAETAIPCVFIDRMKSSGELIPKNGWLPPLPCSVFWRGKTVAPWWPLTI